MFKWLQGQVRKKKSDTASASVKKHSVEAATDAILHDGGGSHEQQPACPMGANTPSDLYGHQGCEPRQEAEGALATPEAEGLQDSPGCPAKCLSLDSSSGLENMAFNCLSNLSSMKMKEEDSVDAHHHFSQENSSHASIIEQPMEDTDTLWKGSSSSLHKNTESLSSLQMHQESKKSTIGSPKNQSPGTTSLQECQSSVFIQEPRETFSCQPEKSNIQKHTNCTSSTEEYVPSVSKSPEHDAGQRFTNIQDFLNNRHSESFMEKSSLCSNPSLVLPKNRTSAEAPPDPPVSPESSCVNQETNNLEENRTNHEEQENVTSQEPGCERTFEVNFAQNTDKYVNGVSFSHLRQQAVLKKVGENAYINDKHLNKDATKENITPGKAAEVPDQVNEPLPSVSSERDFSLECDKVSAKIEKNNVLPVIKVDHFSQTETTKDHCPNPYCYPQACLYNQKGRKCTILGEHFILTYLDLMASPVVVRTSLENTDRGPVGCMIVWCSGKALQFGDLPDGTEIYFDAVVSPKAPSFVAIVMWQDSKPIHTVEPFFNCYVIVELIRNCHVQFLSFAKENGAVSANINGETLKAVFAKSVVYIDGQNIQNANQIKKLSKPISKQLYADVLKLMTLDHADNITYGFMCSCIWLGYKPQQLDPSTRYDRLKLYRRTPGQFVVASKQSVLLCDVHAFIEVEGTAYKLIFVDEGQPRVLSCNKTDFFSGNLKVLPVCGKVKVHLRKTFAKSTYTWQILMVQVEPSLPLGATVNSTLSHQTSGVNASPSPHQVSPADKSSVRPDAISTKCVPRSAILPDVTDCPMITSDLPKIDVVPRPQCKPTTQTTSFVIKEIRPEYGEVAASSHENVLERKSQEAAHNVEEQMELIVKEKHSLHSDNGVLHNDHHAPLTVIRNGNGVFKNVGEAFFLQTVLQGKVAHIEMKNEPLIAFENGKLKRYHTPMSDLSVGFDAHFVYKPLVGPVPHILALWNGKKPVKASLGHRTCYYDVPGVYQGLDEKGCFKFMVLLEGKMTYITTPSTTAIFEASGEQCDSLTSLTHVFVHLSLAQGTYTLILVVLQPKHGDSHVTRESSSSSLSPKPLSVPESETLRSSPVNSQAEAKTVDRNPVPATPTPKASQALKVLAPYLRNFTGTLTKEAGRRVVHTHFKDIPLLVEVPENCNINANGVGMSVKEISLGTLLHFEAFCEKTKNLRYRAVLVWLGKKLQRCEALSGCIYYYNIGGSCLNSNEKEVSLELMLENKPEHVVCKRAYIIMPDGTLLAHENLRVGMLIYTNLIQENQNLSILNDFIYVCVLQAPPPSTVGATLPEEKDTGTSSLTKIINSEKSGLDKPSTLTDNLKDKSVPSEPLGQRSMTADKREVAAASLDPETRENMYDIVKGTVIHLQHDTYIFSDDSENLKVEIDPRQIAVDSPPSPQSPASKFYLLYHKTTQVGMCGWYRHQPRPVYLQHGMIVHTHNPDNKIITLALPDHSSLYNFLFDSDITVTGNKLDRHHHLKSGKRVHPVIEDIKPTLIDGCVVSHRIVFMTTVRDLAGVCLNFLRHSIFADEKEMPRNGTVVSVNHSLPMDCDGLNRNSRRKRRRDHYEDEGMTSLYNCIKTDTSLKQQLEVKQKSEPEDNFNTTVEGLSTSESHSCSEMSVISESVPQVNQLLDGHGYNIPAIDGEGETLRELICTRQHHQIVSKTSFTRFVTLYGEILPGKSGTFVFYSRKLPSPIQISGNLPHCDANMCEGRGKGFLLARKICAKETGFIEHQPVVVWPEKRKCDPYIVVTYKFYRKNNFIMITDAANGQEKWYLCDYNLVFSLKNSYNINEVIKSHCNPGTVLTLYAVVHNIPPFQTQGHYVEGNVLLMTTSKYVAVASIDVFIGSCCEDELFFQHRDDPIRHMLHNHNIRMDRALHCKRGSTYYFSPRDCSFDLNMKVVGGCLEACTDDFAIISCDRRSSTAACHLSNIYYQGKPIESLETIPKNHWKNFMGIILPLDGVMMDDDKWEVNAVAQVAWCCRGPRVVAMHQCYYHVPTLNVPSHEIKDSQKTARTNLSQSQGKSVPSHECCAGAVMSMEELESWQCQAGNTIFTFHKSILQSCGLIKMSGRVTLIMNGTIVLFTSTEKEVVKCKVSDVFIKGKRCESVENVISEMDQTFTLVAVQCSPSIYLGKNIQMEAIVAFTASLKRIGIHICDKHACILESSDHKEEIAIAEETFHDIEVLCEQSAQCAVYYYHPSPVRPIPSKITTSEVETSVPPDLIRTMTYTLHHGFVTGYWLDQECPGQLRVSLQNGPESLTLPVSCSRLMGPIKDLSPQQCVGHPLKVILSSVKRDEVEDYTILTAWRNFSNEPQHVPLCSTPEPELSFSQKSKLLCCPRGLVVKEFQFLYNRNMFEVKSHCMLKNFDVESGIGFFHYWVDESLLSCRIESIAGWPNVNKVQALWSLLMLKGPPTGEDYPKAVAAWQDDCDSLVVQICDVHGTHGLNVSSGGKENKHYNSIPSPARRERCYSESQNGSLLTNKELKPPSRYRQSSESMDSNASAGNNLRQANVIEEDNPVLSGSSPYRTDHPFASVRSKKPKPHVQPNSGDIALLSVEEDSTAEGKIYHPSKVTEHFHTDNGFTSNALNVTAVDIDSCAPQPFTDHNASTNRTSKEKTQHFPERNLQFPNVESFQTSSVAFQPTSVCGSVESNSSEYSLQSKAKTEGHSICNENAQSDQYLHPPHKGSLWAARPTLRIILAEQETVSVCIVEGDTDDYCILSSARGTILSDKKLIGVTQQQIKITSETHGVKQDQEDLQALVLKLEQPVEILGCEVRKIAVAVWNGEKPEIDNSLISKSFDVYKLNWIVPIYNISTVPKNYECKPKVCHSFYATSFQDIYNPCYPECIYYCSQYCRVRQHEVVLVLSEEHVLLEHQGSVALAVMDDVKNSASDLKKGKIFWVITVQLAEPFNYGSHLITDFALLVYSGEVEPSEAATIKLDWGRGKIEKVTTLEKDVDCGLAKVNIIVKVDGPADIKPYSLSYLWPLTPDRPEGDMIFGVECEILTLMQNCGLLKAKGRILNRKEITIFFLRDAVLINSKGLSRHSTFADQMQPVQKQVWRCTCQRLMPQERKSVKKRTSEEAQYKAQLVWCEMCIPSVQGVQVAGNNGVTKATDSTTTTPETPAQSGGGNAWPVGGPVAAAEKEVWGAVKGLGTLDTPLTPASRPKKTHNSKQGTGVGHLTEAYQTVARVTLDDQQLKFVARENCFLYGVCLGKVELWHVLSIGLSINYELTADKKELKMVWVGSVKPLEPALLLSTLRDWCLVHNVTSSASTILQMEAGWLPLDLTPTAGPEEDTDVVEVTAPRVAL